MHYSGGMETARTAAERRTSQLSDVFAWNEMDEHCLRYESFEQAVADLRADYTDEEVVALWVVEEHADGFLADGDPFTESRKWVPMLETDLVEEDVLLTWTTKGWT